MNIKRFFLRSPEEVRKLEAEKRRREMARRRAELERLRHEVEVERLRSDIEKMRRSSGRKFGGGFGGAVLEGLGALSELGERVSVNASAPLALEDPFGSPPPRRRRSSRRRRSKRRRRR